MNLKIHTQWPYLLLVIYSKGGVLHGFSGRELPVWRRAFEKNGTQVAFEQETVHGGLGVHFELREIKSGLLVEKRDGDPTPDAPVWVRDLTPKKLLPPDEE
jgi:hypothetical protein